jgi:NAD(P)-dependent dehydrogenase (short-subunit alcohol dehydrogenase family)
MTTNIRPLAVVTGASSGIGYELAKLAAEDGRDLVIADRPEIVEAAQAHGTSPAPWTSLNRPQPSALGARPRRSQGEQPWPRRPAD